LLFSLGVRDLLHSTAASAQVTLYGFVDDLRIVGEPKEVLKAFQHLHVNIADISLSINNAKSSFTWFHQDEHPLSETVSSTLRELGIPIEYEYIKVLGAIVGKDIQLIKRGMQQHIPKATDPFFARLTNSNLSKQSAMILLRHCGVPKINYLLRCIPPAAIAQLAECFDDMIITLAKRIGDTGPLTPLQRKQLQWPLRKGGFGLTSAKQTSHLAYLSSVAASRAVAVLHQYTSSTHPLPEDCLLYTQLQGCIEMIQLQLTGSVPSPKRGHKQSGDSYAETDDENDDDDPDSDTDADADANAGHSEPVPGQDSDGDTDTTSRSMLLPPSASTFFSFYEHECVFSSSELQSVLHVRATELNFSAAVNHAMRSGDALTAALLVSNAAPYASDWKQALPNSRDTTYSDAWFPYSVRYTLGIAEPGLPAACPEHFDADGNSYEQDPSHALSCNRHKKQGITFRHDGTVQVLINHARPHADYVCREPSNMSSNTDERPDGHIITPRHNIITDVVIANPLCPSHRGAAATSPLATAKKGEAYKTHKYASLAKDHHAKFVPFSAEATGGLGKGAHAVIQCIVKASQDRQSYVPPAQVRRQLRWAIAIAIQKGNAMTIRSGWIRAVGVGRAASAA